MSEPTSKDHMKNFEVLRDVRITDIISDMDLSVQEVLDKLSEIGYSIVKTQQKESQKEYNSFNKLLKYCEKYQLSFNLQMWGKGMYTIYIEKDGVDLKDFGGYDSPSEVIKVALKWLNKVNQNKDNGQTTIR